MGFEQRLSSSVRGTMEVEGILYALWGSLKGKVTFGILGDSNFERLSFPLSNTSRATIVWTFVYFSILEHCGGYVKYNNNKNT